MNIEIDFEIKSKHAQSRFVRNDNMSTMSYTRVITRRKYLSMYRKFQRHNDIQISNSWIKNMI